MRVLGATGQTERHVARGLAEVLVGTVTAGAAAHHAAFEPLEGDGGPELQALIPGTRPPRRTPLW